MPSSTDRPIDLIVIQYSLAHDKKIVIALRPIGATRSAAKQDDRARMQPFHKAPYRLREPGILNRSLWHISLIYRSPRSNLQTVMNGSISFEFSARSRIDRDGA
jgi:hypothetical protein